MALPLFFLPQITHDTLLTLDEDTSRHVVQVLRMKAGEQLQLTDGAGTLVTATIVEVHKKACTVAKKDVHFTEAGNKKVCIAISPLKNVSRFEWFLEKATELGVTEIVPLRCERTEKEQFRYQRMLNIVVSAMLQSRQTWMPILHQPTLFLQAVQTSVYNQLLIAHCDDGPRHQLRHIAQGNSIQILIGPEGDFTPAEIEAAMVAGFQPVTLGVNRLRTETAGVASAAILCM